MKIYFWQGMAIALNLASLFIVIPALSQNPSIYGIYAVCISVTIFLSYADMGFITATYKYAAERYSQADREGEIRLIAFGTFVLFIFVLLFMAVFVYFAFFPNRLIRDLAGTQESQVASKMLFILVLFSFAIVMQRMLQMIFGIRLKDYLYQRTNIFASLVKILSVLYFFRGDHYDIVGYFLFVQIVNLLAVVINMTIARLKFRYDFALLLRRFRFTREVFKETKELAFSSLIITICWVLYYELDSVAIAKLFGARQVAYFSIGFTLMTFLRSIFGTVYSPFSARFNHFIGKGDREGLKGFYQNVVFITLPLVLIPVIGLIILMKPFIISWVGELYQVSIQIGFFLVMSYLLSYISYPAGTLMIAIEKIRQIYIVNILIVIVYWAGIIISMHFINILSFALFKFIAFMIAGLYYLVFSARFLELSTIKLIIKILKASILPLILMIAFLFYAKSVLPVSEEKVNLVYIAIAGMVGAVIFILVYYFTCFSFKTYVNRLYLNTKQSLKSTS